MRIPLTILFLFLASIAYADESAIKTIAYEARGESLEGQIMVASVIKTRMDQSKRTAREVVFKPYQFSCWKDGKPSQKAKLSQKAINTASRAWNEAKVGKYNHYCRYDCRPSWIKAAKSSLRVGNHIFYEL